MPNPFHDRTTQKLEFAKLYLGERKRCRGDGSIPERAHEESFLFHLIGAKDSFLQEINYALGLGVKDYRVNEKTLKTGLTRRKMTCAALDEIEGLELQKGSWLDLAIWLRNHGTHRANIPRAFYLSTSGQDPPTAFHDPYSRQPMQQSIPDFLSHCFEEMVSLLTRLRSTIP